MKYTLAWLEHWSRKHESLDKRVITLFNEEEDGWFEHERILYFVKDNDKQAVEYVKEYIENTLDDIEIFSLSNNKVIFTEENL